MTGGGDPPSELGVILRFVFDEGIPFALLPSRFTIRTTPSTVKGYLSIMTDESNGSSKSSGSLGFRGILGMFMSISMLPSRLAIEFLQNVKHGIVRVQVRDC